MILSRNLAIKLILISTCMAALSLVYAAGNEANAAFDCTSCHRMPPRDTSFRDWLTGGFKGNHQTHQPSGATITDCAVCHAAAGYTNGHMNRRIEFQANIKNSPAIGVYRVNGAAVAFKNQTTVPQLGLCSNVNCHFETDTPLWGSAPFTYVDQNTNDCNRCHGAPPAGAGPTPAGGAAGSHGKHDLYYGGVGKCGTCHPNHLTDINRFSHATSAGGRSLVVRPKDPLGIAGGSYTGALNDYLPSLNNSFGSCAGTYCHSEGKSFAAPYIQQSPVTWGSAVSCTGCHNGAPTYTSGKANSHSKHIFACDKCHADVYASGAIVNRSLHVNKSYDIKSGAGSAFALSVQGTPSTPTQCGNISCHAGGTATWGGTLGCGGCHADMSSLSGSGSHPKHGKTYSLGCNLCHGSLYSATEVTSPDHANEAVNLGFTGTATGTVYSKGNSFPAFTPYGTCSSSYCHSNGNGGAALVTARWGDKLDCRGCHGGDADHPNVIAGGKHRNHLDPAFNLSLGAKTGLACASCHVKTVAFSNNTTVINRMLHVNTLKEYSGARAGKMTAAGQCANVYCHSSGQAIPAFRTMTGSKLWTGNAVLRCNGCHGYGPGAFTPVAGEPNYANGGINSATANNHLIHVNGAGITDSRGCAKCHAKTVEAATSDKLKNYSTHHIDGNRDVNFPAAVGGSYAAAGKSCSNTKCHGAGNPQWGGTPLACNACHGANFTSFSSAAKKGAHAAHYQSNTFSTYAQPPANSSTATQYRFTCSSCHAAPAGHSNLFNSAGSLGVAEVFFGFTSAGKKPAYTYGTTIAGTDSGVFTWTAGGSGSCNATYCHSNGAGGNGADIRWNSPKGTLACTGCHGNAASNTLSGKHAVHLNPTVNPSLGAGNGLLCIDCHAKTVSGATVIRDKSRHVNKFTDYSSIRGGGSSGYNPFSHLCSNSYCHSNGNRTALAYVPPPAWNSASTLSCNGCHGTSSAIGAPDYPNGGAGSATANSHAPHTAGYASTVACSDCHAKTADMTTGGKLKNYSAASYHINGTANVTFNKSVAGASITWNPSNGQCNNILCHGNSSATWGSTAGCLTCHENGIGNRAGIGSQFRANSHHVQGVTVNGTHCHKCHWEANSDGTINRSYHQRTLNAPVDLVIYGSGVRPTTYSVGTTAVQYTANGTRTELAKINLHCLGCHSTANDAATPFNDGKTPKSYAWDSTSIKARYGDTTTTTWGKYSGGNVTPKNKVTKAFSAHGNATANQGGWDLNETWPNKRAGTVNILCFDCHNAHGSTVSGTTTSYASATVNGGILKDTVAGKGGYSTTYKPAAGGSSANRNSYNAGAGLCFDCHLNASSGITPWGYSSTFGATQAILGYTDTPYFGLGTFGTQQRYPYKATANMGGHLGVSSTLLVSATRPINGLCTPCHDPHGVSTAMGANRQYAVPLLKGTWVTSPYKEDTATRDNRNYLYLAAPANQHAPRPTPGTYAAYTSAIKSYKIDQNTFASNGTITQTDAQFAGLCLSCHPKSSLTGTTHTWKSKDRVHESVKGWKTANTTIKHSYSCSKCHAPHNARLPRLMVSNCLDYKHRGRVTNNASPVTSGSYIGDDGSGSGRIPGSYAGGRSRGGAYVDNTFTCHENYDSGQKWNTKTPWTQ